MKKIPDKTSIDFFTKNKLNELSVFKNAYLIYHGGLIQLDEKTENATYYAVTDPDSEKEHIVTIYFDSNNKVIKLSCECTIQSLKCKQLPLCSHMMAAVVQSMFDLGRQRRAKHGREE